MKLFKKKNLNDLFVFTQKEMVLYAIVDGLFYSIISFIFFLISYGVIRALNIIIYFLPILIVLNMIMAFTIMIIKSKKK